MLTLLLRISNCNDGQEKPENIKQQITSIMPFLGAWIARHRQ
jgi:hypothetical protein